MTRYQSSPSQFLWIFPVLAPFPWFAPSYKQFPVSITKMIPYGSAYNSERQDTTKAPRSGYFCFGSCEARLQSRQWHGEINCSLSNSIPMNFFPSHPVPVVFPIPSCFHNFNSYKIFPSLFPFGDARYHYTILVQEVSYRKHIARQHLCHQVFSPRKGSVVDPVNFFLTSNLIMQNLVAALMPCARMGEP